MSPGSGHVSAKRASKKSAGSKSGTESRARRSKRAGSGAHAAGTSADANDEEHPINGDAFLKMCNKMSEDAMRMILLLNIAQSQGIKLSPNANGAIAALGIDVVELQQSVLAVLEVPPPTEKEPPARSEAPSPKPKAEPSDDDDRGVGSSSTTSRRRAREEEHETDDEAAQRAAKKKGKRRVHDSEEE